MANYNNGNYIQEAIESVIHQNFSDWELLIMDDGSTDDSISRINAYLNDKRITPDLMRYALNNKKIILFGGNATRTFCYVSDAISAMLKILLIKKTKILTFNVGHDRNEITIKKISNIFSEIVLGILNKKLQVILKKSNDKDYLKLIVDFAYL